MKYRIRTLEDKMLKKFVSTVGGWKIKINHHLNQDMIREMFNP